MSSLLNSLLLSGLTDSAGLLPKLAGLILFLIYTAYLASRIARPSLSEWWLTTFLLGAGSVILTGFVLSSLYLTANTLAWGLGVFVTATVVGGLLHWLSGRPVAFSVPALVADRRKMGIDWFYALPPYLNIIFSVLLLTLSVIAVTNLLLVLFTVPNEWDSMTGHLNRVMQYVQRGTMRHFGGTNWNIDTYPKSVCTLQIYGFLMTNRFENGFKFIHHLSYWTAIVSVFGIVQRISQLITGKANLTAGFFCALVYALVPDFLMQAITTETDIVLTA